MSWFARFFGRDEPPEDPIAARVADLSAAGLPALLRSIADEPAAVRRAVLQQARVQIGDEPALLLALARTGPADAAALWGQLAELPANAAEAHDALADLAETLSEAQAHRERAAAAAPGDLVRLRRALGDRPTRQAPRLALGPWPPLIDRLPAAYTVRGPIGRGPHGLVTRVVGERAWAAKALRSDLAGHAALDAVFADLATVAAMTHPGLAEIAHLDPARAFWIRTLGVAPWTPSVDLAPVRAALEMLHAAGIPHGAVSPANLIVDGDGQARLTDVGVCRLSGVRPDPAADLAALDRLMEAP